MKTRKTAIPQRSFIAVFLVIGLVFAGIVMWANAQPAQAGHIGCGAVLSGSGSTYTLDSDVGPCDDDTGPALTVDSGVSLNLNGFRVYCEDRDADGILPDGILVQGDGASVSNSTLNGLNGCKNGVVVTGDGNTLSMVASRDNAYDGFRIEGSNNSVNGNTATGNGKAMVGCPDEADEGSGFSIIHGDGNTLTSNVTDGNACDGILVDSDSNLIQLSYANGNGRYGIYVEGGVGFNRIVFNNAWGNAKYDMSDENPNCGTNVWRFNFFTYADQSCIR